MHGCYMFLRNFWLISSMLSIVFSLFLFFVVVVV